MKLIAGQVAVITGGASGIGAALGRQLIDRGLAVVLLDVEAGALSETAAALSESSASARVSSQVVDVTDSAAMIELAARIQETHGRIDLIANNAGVVGPRVPLWEQRVEDFQWVLNVNLWGVINGLQAFVPYLVRAGAGHVLNTASIAALTTIAGGGNAPYTASKHAVVGLSDALREELSHAAPAVGVTVLCPGPVATRIRDAARNRPSDLDPGELSGSASSPAFEHRAATISADEAARRAIDAIELDRFWVLTNPENADEVRACVADLLADLEGPS